MSEILWLKYDSKINKIKKVTPCRNCVSFFDSGMGGLSIVEYIAKKFPDETFLFYKDKDNFPYGIKTQEELYNIGEQCIKNLLKYNPTTICIACNTMCCALTAFQSPLPIIKINELIVKEVKLKLPIGKKILVICTNFTKNSNFYQDNLKEYIVKVYSSTDLVNMVEQNEITKEKVAKVILDKPFDADGIILGCTHFNYLRDIFYELLGEKVYIFDGLKNLEQYIKKFLNLK